MKKLKKFFKLLILILLIVLLIFASFAGYKFSKYAKVSKGRKAFLESDNLKIVEKRYPVVENAPTTTRTGIKANDKIIIKSEAIYPEELKASDSIIRDVNSAMYYVKSKSLVTAYENTLLVNFIDKTFFAYDTAIPVAGLIENMYPNVVDAIYLGELGSLQEKFFLFKALFPAVMKMKFATIDDNGRKAFITESEKGVYYGGEDREYTITRNYYDIDTMIIYKQTKLKPDGTEKIVADYEIVIGNVSEAESSYPDLTEYRQVFEE